RSHVSGFFLDPDDVSAPAVAGGLGGAFFLRGRIALVQKDDRSRSVFSLLALGLKFVADFSGADENAVGFSDFGVGNDVLKIGAGEVGDGRRSVSMAQHALRRENNERFTPVAQGLAAQQMKILRGV